MPTLYVTEQFIKDNAVASWRKRRRVIWHGARISRSGASAGRLLGRYDEPRIFSFEASVTNTAQKARFARADTIPRSVASGWLFIYQVEAPSCKP